MANRHKDKEIIAVDKALKTRTSEFRAWTKHAEAVAAQAYKFIADCGTSEASLDAARKDTLRKTEEAFQAIHALVDAAKNEALSKISRSTGGQRESAQKTISELQSLVTAVMRPVDCQSLSIDTIGKELAHRKETVAKIEELMRSPVNGTKNEVECSVSEKEIDVLMKRIKVEFSKITEKSQHALPPQPSKLSERPLTPSKAHLHSTKSNVKPLHENRPASTVTGREAPLTPKNTKDLTKKSFTRSKSPIFKTDIRRWL